MERPLLTEEELEEHISETTEWLKEEKEDWAKENLRINLNYFIRLLRYYNKGFDEGYKQGKEDSI